ncbi:Fe(3+)-hydroxamate ABC transporter permease FhuB [Paraburkholderia edwinii]|uniref:Fe(3+)-hydroxamate ABC transporter permease FhuB n=2 Tax=Paraburkholderia edwinii TaxID=2861782 RepID=A0ABX8UR39_9BURK|nr:Fe(3+)-hydroxamate ABC transporter permease FhuB [Paraburkholderia edwinii]
MNRIIATGAQQTRRTGWMPLLLVTVTVWLTGHTLGARLPVDQWQGALLLSRDATLPQLVIHYSWLPRLAMALAAGAALSLAGVVFQQVLRNPLAEPLTLGVSAGAYLALTIAAIIAPALVPDLRFGVALAGASVAMLVTLALTWRRGFAPVSVVLAGMIMNLYCGALVLVLTITYERSLAAIFIWGGGSLSQNGWATVAWFVPRALVCTAGIALLARPLTLFSLDDGSASQLGLSLRWMRPAALALAVILSAFVVSAVGVISFIGLAGPVLARLAGARRLRDQLLWAPLVGAGLLTLADQAVQSLPGMFGELLPTGAALALGGGPLLLAMLRKLRTDDPRMLSDPNDAPRRTLRGTTLVLVTALAVAMVVSLGVTVTAHGWHWTPAAQWPTFAFWRVPRTIASLGAGVMVALAGAMLQRMTGNPMASPELLGVSGGAMLGMLGAALAVSAPSAPLLLLSACAGALICLAAIIVLGRRSGFAPQQVLLGGIALSAFAQSAVMLATSSGGAYAALLRPLTYGSTYIVLPGMATVVALCTCAGVLVAYLCSRWLDMLPLGADVADALGVSSKRARLVLLVAAASMTAIGTVVIGPMSFVGLMAPHLARLLGFARARSSMFVTMLIGATLMVVADWLGRVVIFPQQMPAGVLAALIGAPWLMWLLRR